MDQNEIITLAGVFFSGLVMGVVGYLKKKPEQLHSDPIVTGVGLELGNRLQLDQLITEVKRCADSLVILADRRQASLDSHLARIMERLDDAEEREMRAREAPPRRTPRRRAPRGE